MYKTITGVVTLNTEIFYVGICMLYIKSTFQGLNYGEILLRFDLFVECCEIP